jgi:NAD+ diphosphatase
MFEPLFVPRVGVRDDCLVVAVSDRRVAIRSGEPPAGALFLGLLDGRQCWAYDVDTGLDAKPSGGTRDGTPDGAALETTDGAFLDLRSLWGCVDEETWVVAGRGLQIVDWDRTHRYCGRCGAATEPSSGERSRRCPVCGLTAYPRLAPAVIVLVERADGRVLLARNAHFPGPMWSTLAGFVEPGEKLEEAVRREVREEVGVELEGITYFGSQPWPFPHSLMIGFTARWASGAIVVDEDEIAEAGWFAADDLPQIPTPISIARQLIDAWRARMGAGD